MQSAVYGQKLCVEATLGGMGGADERVAQASVPRPDLDDIRQRCEVESEGIFATIAGRAIYDGTLDFATAQEEADRLTQS